MALFVQVFPRLALIAIVLFPALLTAQVPDPYVAAQAPIPGSGHHYIGDGAETVSPADGSLSFDLPIQTPSGRGLSFPFGIRYSHPEEFYINGNAGVLSWAQWTMPQQSYGWSYDLPGISATTMVAGAAPDQQGHTLQCLGTGNYVFRGLDGVSRTLYVGNLYSDPANQGQLGGFCPTTILSAGNTHGVLATLPTSWSPPTQPPVKVVDQSGTTYQFGPGPSEIGVGGSSPQHWGFYAPSIIDRNGNQITLNTNNKGYTDSLGRSLLSWTGLGTNGDTITVSGLGGNIVLHWTTFSRTLGVTGTNLGPSVCSAASPASKSISGITEIDLPNTQKYTFAYDATYGRVSKITFPGGGYVRYVWGLNSLSTVTRQSWWIGTSNATCNFRYGTPAITDRYVSYDGSTEVLHQHFAYSTTWSGSAWTRNKQLSQLLIS